MSNVFAFPIRLAPPHDAPAEAQVIELDAGVFFSVPVHEVARNMAQMQPHPSAIRLLRQIVQTVLGAIADGMADPAKPNPLRLPYPVAVRRAADLLQLIDELEQGAAQD